MTYRFKPLPELYWSVVTAAATVLLLELVGLNPDRVTDWRGWAVALGAAVIRAAAGAALDYIRRSIDEANDPTPALADQILALDRAERARLTETLEQRRRSPSTPPVPPPPPPPETDINARFP